MTTDKRRFEVIVIGAGVGGIYQIKRLVDLGIDAIVLEGEADLGGTWYRNRYPGARFDSESYTYGYSFSREVLDEWHWVERFSPQPENLRYLNFVADKFDLRRHMRFNTWIDRLVWDEDNRLWHLTDRDGTVWTARFVISAIGVLSVPTMPRLEGIDSFKGEAYHTFHWPAEPVPLAGRRVGVIGTGATAIQVIAEIADKVGELFVFQRRPNWSVPLNNSAISAEEMAQIRARYDEIFANCARSPGGFEHLPDRRGFWNVSPEERRRFWDELYETPGFAILNANFMEIFVDPAANREISDYIADRIRQRVKDPAVAERLIPRDHGFGTQRLPLETHYFEAYNRDNVHLVSLQETPIERVTATGIQTSARHYDLDLIIYATGFDAITGAFDRIDIHGTGGQRLAERWQDGPRTWFGLLTHGFPNLLMIAGPQSISGSANYPRTIEGAVNWATTFLEHARAEGATRFEVAEEAEAEWQQEVVKAYDRLLLNNSKGWFSGYNSNLVGHEAGRNRYPAYFGGGPKFTKLVQQAAAEGFRQVSLR